MQSVPELHSFSLINGGGGGGGCDTVLQWSATIKQNFWKQ